MQVSQERVLREVTEYPGCAAPTVDLCRLAACVFGGGRADEDAAAEVVRAGQELAEFSRDAELTDIGFFLVTWGAEAIAATRIAAGDFGIDETLRRMHELPGAAAGEDDPWREMVAEYRALADEILIDTLNEFREFEAVVLYSGNPGEYTRRRAAGMAALLRRCGRAASGAPLPC